MEVCIPVASGGSVEGVRPRVSGLRIAAADEVSLCY
jgi:hypothetical protein